MENEWELSKENIQPRRQGRDINCLMTALTPFKDDNRKRLDDERGTHETRIRTYDGDDPISVWSEYISWSEQHFPKDHKNTFMLLEKCIEDILIQERYKSDSRALSIWLKYNDLNEDPLPIFQFMFSKDICTTMAAFYIDWALALENVGDSRKANEVLHFGINRGAQPINRLESHIKNFDARLMKKIQQEGDPCDEDADSYGKRAALSTLRKDKKGTVSYDRTRTKNSSKGLSVNQTHSNSREGKFVVYQDQENADPMPVPGSSSKWKKPPVQTQLKRENTVMPGPWNKQKIPVAVKSSSLGQFSIHVDEETVTPQRPTPQRIFSDRKPLSAKKLEKKGNSDKLLDHLNKDKQQGQCLIMCDTERMYSGTEEFSFEEIKAALYLKKEEELRQLLMDDNRTKIIGVEMSLSPDVTTSLVNGAHLLQGSPPVLQEDKFIFNEGDKENPRQRGSTRQQLVFEPENQRTLQEVSPKLDAEDIPFTSNHMLNANAPNGGAKKTVNILSTENQDNISIYSKINQEDFLGLKNSSTLEGIPQIKYHKETPSMTDLDEKDSFPPFGGLSISKDEDFDVKVCNTRELKRTINSIVSPLRDHGKGKRLNLFNADESVVNSNRRPCLSTSIHTEEALKTVQEMFNQTIDAEKTQQANDFSVKDKDSFDNFELQFKSRGNKTLESSVKPQWPFQIYAEDELEVADSVKQRKSRSSSEDPLEDDCLPLAVLGDKLQDRPNNDNWFIPIQNNTDVSQINDSVLSSQMRSDCLKVDENRLSSTTTGTSVRPHDIPPTSTTRGLVKNECISTSIAATGKSLDKEKTLVNPTPSNRPQFAIFEDALEENPGTSQARSGSGRVPFSVLRDNDDENEVEKAKHDKLPFSLFDDSFMNSDSGRGKGVPTGAYTIKSDGIDACDTKNLIASGRDELAEDVRLYQGLHNPQTKLDPEQDQDLSIAEDRFMRLERSLYSIHEKTLPLEDSIIGQACLRGDPSVTLDVGTTILSVPKGVCSSTPFSSTRIEPPDPMETYPLPEKEFYDLKAIEVSRAPLSSVSMNESLIADDWKKEINNATSNPIELPAGYQTTYTNFYTQSDLSPIDEGSEGSKTNPHMMNESSHHVHYSFQAEASQSTAVSSTTIVDTGTLIEQKSKVESFYADQGSETQRLANQQHDKYQETETASEEAGEESSNGIVVNPFDGNFVSQFVLYTAELWQNISSFQKVPCALPRIQCKSRMQIDNFEYQIHEEVGSGGFGKVYKVSSSKDPNADTFYALKVVRVKEICVLEHYIGHKVHSRIEELDIPKDMHNAFVNSSKAFIFDDGGCLEMQYYRGTLLDLVNMYRIENRSISEAFASMLTLELLKIMETLHECGVIHGDLKPDNIFCLELDQDCNPTTTNLLLLGDYGRAIDVSVLHSDTMFCGSCNTDSFECIQMRESRPWKFQVDYFALANTLHVLIFGNYLNLYKESNTGRWRKTSSFKRSWDQLLWTTVFDTLINHEGMGRSSTIRELLQPLWNRRGHCLQTCDIREELRAFQQLKRIPKKH